MTETRTGDNLANQRKIGAILSYAIVAVNIITGIFYTPIVIRLLGQVEYGLYSLIYSFMSYFTILDFGLRQCYCCI